LRFSCWISITSTGEAGFMELSELWSVCSSNRTHMPCQSCWGGTG
jgi:hypothetical protein